MLLSARAAAAMIFLLPAAVVHAAAPQAQTQPAQVTCVSSYPNNVHPQDNNIYRLSKTTLADGTEVWRGRFKMYSPRDNNTECRVRQILFRTGRLVDDVPGNAPDSPKVSVTVQHGIFRRPAKDFVLATFTQPQDDGGTTFYTVQAQSAQPKSGIYYAKIKVVGRPAH